MKAVDHLAESTLRLLAVMAVVPLGLASGQMMSIGSRQLYIHCSGNGPAPTVILEAGAGGNSANFEKVQTELEKVGRVCSYDRAGLGKSEKPTGQQTENGIVDDLHQLLVAVHEPGPYLLVGHSLGGVYARAFQMRYPQLVDGLVLVDSSHEEQLNRFTALSPELGKQFATQGGRSTYDEMYRLYGQLRPGATLQWRVDIPVVVIEHKRPTSPVASSSSGQSGDLPPIEREWHQMQADLARRSTCAQLWEAPKSGHDIPGEQPDLVVKAVSVVLGEIRSGCRASADTEK
jgi:pimeloyl-ACP methyl ester carboxylesterase